jgi:peptide/nickel transport system ATP-binding protein
MAIALKPRLLVADEPTTALDVGTQAQILALLQRLVREDGSALLLVTHDLAVVAELADRVAVLRQGRLVEQGEAVQVLSQPRESYTAGLLADSRLRRDLPASASATRPATDAPPLLAVQALVREYRLGGGLWTKPTRLRAVDGVSLTVQAGETVGLVGESGCGKSTLLRSVLGLEPLQGGEIRLRGQPCTGPQAALRRSVQIVFQDPYGSFDPRWRVGQLVAEPLHLLARRCDAAERRRRVGTLLEQVGLQAGDADRFPHEFSGGQRQRIAIARALITEPALVVLDEAVSALDVTVRGQILALLARLARQRGLAYLFVSHDLAVVRAFTERVYVMAQGRIVESGATEAVFSRPQHACTARLLAATPDLDRALAQRRQAAASPQPAETLA